MAGRKNKYTVDYFPHYCSGDDSKTMFILENKFGLVGYAVWFKTLELLGKSENHYIDLRDDTDMLFLISKLGITEEKFTEIYNLLAKLEAIDLDLWNSKIIFSDNFVSNIEDAYVRRKGIDVLHKYDLCKHLSIKCGQKLPNQSKPNQSKPDEIKIEDRKADFEKSLTPFLETYDNSLLNDFFQYWTEHGERDKKMRFEKEKSFGISRRLSTWKEKEKSFAKKENEEPTINRQTMEVIKSNSKGW